MQRSLKEVGDIVQRAGAGVELPLGLEAEVGDAALWLEGRGLHGVDIAAASLARYREDGEAQKIGLVDGVEILDELTENQKRNPDAPAAWNDDVFCPAGLLPYAARKSRGGLAVHLVWQQPGSPERGLALCAHGSMRLRFTEPSIMSAAASYPTSIVISARPMPVSGPIPTQIVLDAWELDRRLDAAVMKGVTVPDEAWSLLSTLSDLTLVPDDRRL